jgi:thiol:disulfide interchange protein DsbC
MKSRFTSFALGWALLALVVACTAMVAPTFADAGVVSTKPEKPDMKADPRAEIAKRLDVLTDAIRPSALSGIFEVSRGGEVLYVSADGRYALSGDLYDTGTGKNLTEKRRIEARSGALKAIADSDTIIFTPKSPRYSVTVFTDVDCSYCRKLHSEIAEYNRLGIRVRYVFYPRSGPGTDSWRKAESVWCAADRQAALTLAKSGKELPSNASCGPTPVARTYALGQELGMRGTPGIFTERGNYFAGYYGPERLLQKLKEIEAAGPG